MDFFSFLRIILNQQSVFTCKIVKTILLEDLINQREELPHLWGHLLTCQTVSQGQDLLIEFCKKKKNRKVS